MAENLIEAVERLEQVSATLERLLYGDPRSQQPGMISQFEGLRRDVGTLHDEVQRLKARRPNVWLWIMGYVMFCGSVTFGVVGVLNQTDVHQVWGLPAALAGAALILFLGGFGWLDRAA